MSDYETVLYDQPAIGVARIVMNRPAARNAQNLQMGYDLNAAFDRAVADDGVIVSAHPDAIQRLGTKDVLFETRGLPFGSDVHRIDSLEQLATELPQRLKRGVRVLKQHRGHSGIGVWRVERSGDCLLTVQHAQRGSAPQRMDMPMLQATLAPYFDAAAGSHMIDQAWQPRLAEGMVRAYLVEDRVAGFGHHLEGQHEEGVATQHRQQRRQRRGQQRQPDGPQHLTIGEGAHKSADSRAGDERAGGQHERQHQQRPDQRRDRRQQRAIESAIHAVEQRLGRAPSELPSR